MNLFYPIELFADLISYSFLWLSKTDHFWEAVNFFVYDTIKIVILLSVIIFVVSIIRTFLPQEKIRRMIAGKHPLIGHLLAGLLGIVTPFCTCSAIPLFLGFVEAGVPLGITFTFLVASPMINEVALVMLAGMFGMKIALLYIASGLVVAIVSGMIIGKLKVENLVEDFVYKNKTSWENSQEISYLSWKEKMKYATHYTKDILLKVWPYLIIGISLWAWIHGFVPADFLVRYAGSDNLFAVPVAVLIGIPLYSNAAGIIPLVSTLTEKWVAIGTTLAFMMAVTGLSLPEFMILKKIMKVKLILIFAGVVGIGIILTGYFFNYVLR